MIILDTNVVSEGIHPACDSKVAAWFDRQHSEKLFLTSTSLAELMLGVELLPNGRRKADLATRLDAGLVALFKQRLLSFDRDAAKAYAGLVTKARRQGLAIAVSDGQIAAVALTRGFAVATRDTAPFIAAGVETIDPWKQ
jgi:predicted nucleic acid-binding protein